MAYNFCVVQRLSDGKYQDANGSWRTLDFTSNYSMARFYYSDADDVANYITGYPNGDYRVVEYWMPGNQNSNPPKSNNTLLGNFLGSLYSANAVTIDSIRGDFFTTSTTIFQTDFENASRNRERMWLVLSEADVATYGVEGAIDGTEVGGALQPSEFYFQVIAFDGRNYFLGGFANGMDGQSFQYEVTR